MYFNYIAICRHYPANYFIYRAFREKYIMNLFNILPVGCLPFVLDFEERSIYLCTGHFVTL